MTDDKQIRRIAQLTSRSRRGIKGATFMFAPNRLYWTTKGIDPRRFLDRLDTALMTYLIAAGLFFTGFAAFWAPLPLFLTDIGFDSGRIFALYLASSLASAVLYEGAGKLASRYDVRWLQAGSLAVRGVFFPATALVTGFGAASLGFGTVGIVLAAIGMTWAVIAVVGTTIVTRLAPPSIRGETLGIHTALAAVASGVGGLLGGWIATFGYLIAFGVAGGLVLLGSGLVLSVPSITTGDRVPDERPTAAPDLPGEATISAFTEESERYE